jgi:hypothetical protein
MPRMGKAMTFKDLRKLLADAHRMPLTVSRGDDETQLTWRADDGTAFTASGPTPDDAAEKLFAAMVSAGEAGDAG